MVYYTWAKVPGRCPLSSILNVTHFGNMICFHPQVESWGDTWLGPSEGPYALT
jgi:hypothetical protein